MIPKNTPTKDQLEELYGSPASLRLPVNLKKRITEDALLRGQTFSSYAADLLANAYQKGQDKAAEFSLLIREKEQLQQHLQKLKDQFEWVNTADWQVLQKLKRNRDILKERMSQPNLEKAQLEKAGFDFHFATHHVKIDNNHYFGVLDFCYRIELDQVHILSLQP